MKTSLIKQLRFVVMLFFLTVCMLMRFMPSTLADVIDKVVAIVNNEIITQSDIEKTLAPIAAQYMAIYPKEEIAQKLAEAKDGIIERLIENKLILDEAKNLRIIISEDEIKEKVNKLQEQFSSLDEFQSVLLRQGLNKAELEKKYREQIAIQRVIDYKIKSKIVIKPTEVVDCYYANLDSFTHPKELKISHILVRIDESLDTFSAYRRARRAFTLLDKGSDFAEVAREYSDGPRSASGGDVGFVALGQMLKEIDDAIFNMEAGEVSGLIKSNIGYHIVKVDEIRSPYLKDLSDVQSEVEDILYRKKVEERFSQWMKELKDNAVISIKAD